MPDEKYAAYLARCDRALGPVAVGGYGKWNGKLVRKLTPDEFAERDKELDALTASYDKILANGHTISNALVRAIRERAADLLLDSPC